MTMNNPAHFVVEYELDPNSMIVSENGYIGESSYVTIEQLENDILEFMDFPINAYNVSIDVFWNDDRYPIYREPAFIKSEYPEYDEFFMGQLQQITWDRVDCINDCIKKYSTQTSKSLVLQDPVSIGAIRAGIVFDLIRHYKYRKISDGDCWTENGICFVPVPHIPSKEEKDDE